MAPCALSYASDGGYSQDLSKGGQSEGAKRPSGGRGVGGGGFLLSRVGRFVNILCQKTAFSCTLDTIIRGSICSGIDQLPTLVLFSFFS